MNKKDLNWNLDEEVTRLLSLWELLLEASLSSVSMTTPSMLRASKIGLVSMMSSRSIISIG